MASTADESGDDTTSSLGDSSYDFVEDRSNVTTDDEDQDAMTASTSSIDGHTFEQVDVVAHGQEYDRFQRNSRDSKSTTFRNQQGLTQLEQNPSGQDTLSVGLDHEVHHEHGPIEFDEPSITHLNSTRLTEVSHTLKIIEKQNCPNEFHYNLLDRLHGYLAVTVRQTMTSRSLIPKDGQYKIMYVGDIGARGPILQKIGMALATSLKTSSPDSRTTGMSKFNVIPISAFGDENTPDVVLIDASGLEMIVEDCVYASFAKKEGGNDSLRLEMSGGANVHSSWDGSRFIIPSNWRLPDLAIFCLPDNDNLALRRTCQFARSFMSRHKVLTIVISQSATWDKPSTEPVTLDYLTPHVCLESRKSNFVQAHVIRRYPIDLGTFLSIDAGQMNRNLACLVTACTSSNIGRDDDVAVEKIKRRPSKSPWSVRELVLSIVSDVQKDGLRGLNRYEYLAGFVLCLMSVLGVVVLGLGLSEFLSASRVSTSRVFPVTAREPSMFEISSATVSPSAVSALTTTSTLISRSPSSTSVHVIPTKGSSANTDLASFLLDAYTLAPNKSDHFKVHVLGDCHIVLRPPHWFTKMKRSPNLLFKVLRGEVELEHKDTALFDGVYALQIPREHAHGLLNLAVWTETKPVVTEKFEVNFGTSWLKVAGWKKATSTLTDSLRGDLNSVQTGLSIVYDYTKTSLSAFVRQPKRVIAAQSSADRAILKSHLEAASKIRSLLIAHTKDLQRTFSKRLFSPGIAASARIAKRAEGTSKRVILYTHSKATTFLQQARHLAQKSTDSNIKSLLSGYGNFRKRHLRATQKRALKAWWSMNGAPHQTNVRVRVKDESSPHHET